MQIQNFEVSVTFMSSKISKFGLKLLGLGYAKSVILKSINYINPILYIVNFI